MSKSCRCAQENDNRVFYKDDVALASKHVDFFSKDTAPNEVYTEAFLSSVKCP